MKLQLRRTPVSLAVACLLTFGFATPVFAQDGNALVLVIEPGATIEVTGIGRVELPAEGAIVQMVAYSYGSFGAEYQEAVPASGIDATPMPVPEVFTMQPPAVTVEQAAAVTAVFEEFGISPDSYGTRLSDALVAGFYGSGTAIIGVKLDAAQVGQLDLIVAKARQAATEVGISIDQFNVVYLLDDCTAPNREAANAALADGEAQAIELAAVLEVELGGLVKASTQSILSAIYFTGFTPAGPCDPDLTLEDAFTSYFSGSPTNGNGTVEIYSAIVLTFAVK